MYLKRSKECAPLRSTVKSTENACMLVLASRGQDLPWAFRPGSMAEVIEHVKDKLCRSGPTVGKVCQHDPDRESVTLESHTQRLASSMAASALHYLLSACRHTEYHLRSVF